MSLLSYRGNTKFRALCFSRKPEFEAGNHAVKRRIAAEIVNVTKALPGRFLKRKNDKGPWFEISAEKAILKACQVMRDFQRPDRLALREMASANGARKRQRTSESTPGVNLVGPNNIVDVRRLYVIVVGGKWGRDSRAHNHACDTICSESLTLVFPLQPVPSVPLAPIVENPYGVHDHDVLSGRGAFVNGHVGNERFRQLSIDRKPQFDAGNYSEKRALATEIVTIIRSLDPPGRFLKRVSNGGSNNNSSTSNNNPANKEDEGGGPLQARGLDGGWEELSDDRAIHKACQVMRDLNRPDRAAEKKSYTRKTKKVVPNGSEVKEEDEDEKASSGDESADAEDGAEAMDEAVLGSDEVLDKALVESVAVAEGDRDLEDEEKEQVEVMQV